MVTKYDDASWHYNGDFPEDLEPAAGATHFALFAACCFLHGMASDELQSEAGAQLRALGRKELTPGGFIMAVCDEKLTSDDLNAEGNAFAVAYFMGRDDESAYIDDFLDVFEDYESVYETPDTWASYKLISVIIDEQYRDWVAAGRPEFVEA